MKVKCHDCYVEEGELHDYGCDMERCPFCGGQLLSCPCRYKALGYNYDWDAPNSGLPEDIYNKGLPPEEEEIWQSLLRGVRVPWIEYPVICRRCGKLWPDMFSVPDEEWEYYIQKSERDKVICPECYEFIKNAIDSNKKETPPS